MTKITGYKTLGRLLLILILMGALEGRPEDPAAQPKLQTKELMDQFLVELTALKPYLISEDTFKDPSKEAQISSHLREFARLARLAEHDKTLARENYKFSRYVFQEHVVDTERSFRLGNKSYARWQLMSTISMCMNCHIQMPMTQERFGQFANPKIFTSDFDQAEFLFATRAFDQALKIYQRLVREYPKNKLPREQLETALERELAYYSRLKRDPNEGLTQLKSRHRQKSLPEPLRKNLTAWISQFESWKKEPAFDPRKASEQQIVKFARDNLNETWTSDMMSAENPKLVAHLRVSGILLEYLQTHPESKAVPEVLYWLAICERSINYSFFFSLADFYLRECMIKFAADPTAKKCFKEYESQKIFGYTGSSGTHLPPEVVKDLKQLKELVETGGKVRFYDN